MRRLLRTLHVRPAEIAIPMLSMTMFCAWHLAVMSARFSASAKLRSTAGWVATKAVREMALPTLAMPASGMNRWG